MSTNPHYAMVQVDLDGLDSVLDCYGSSLGDGEEDRVYTDGVVRLLDLLKECDIKATFFLIGKDYEVPYKKPIIERMVREGHELANHTYSHPLSFARLGAEGQQAEINRCNAVIASAGGGRAAGFRAPGYAITSGVIDFLEKQQFAYDASVFPCAFSWLIRLWQSIASPSLFEKEKYGASSHAIAPQFPYFPDKERIHRCSRGERDICEVPVSTTSLFRLPFHGSYVMILARISVWLGMTYWKIGFSWYHRRRLPYVFVIHPLELTDVAHDRRLGAQIGYDTPRAKKEALYRGIFRTLKEKCEPVTTSRFVEEFKIRKIA